jgi:hypothetical protein
MIEQSKDILRSRKDCPIWHSPLLYIVIDGVEIRCKSCRGQVHHISREELEVAWATLKSQTSHVSETSS